MLALTLGLVPAGAAGQSLDPVPRPRPTLPVEAPPPPPVPAVETPPPIFVPGFVPKLNSQPAGSDPNVVLMAPFEVKDRSLMVLNYKTPRPPPYESPVLRFLRTGILYEHVGKDATIAIGIFGIGISW